MGKSTGDGMREDILTDEIAAMPYLNITTVAKKIKKARNLAGVEWNNDLPKVIDVADRCIKNWARSGLIYPLTQGLHRAHAFDEFMKDPEFVPDLIMTDKRSHDFRIMWGRIQTAFPGISFDISAFRQVVYGYEEMFNHRLVFNPNKGLYDEATSKDIKEMYYSLLRYEKSFYDRNEDNRFRLNSTLSKEEPIYKRIDNSKAAQTRLISALDVETVISALNPQSPELVKTYLIRRIKESQRTDFFKAIPLFKEFMDRSGMSIDAMREYTEDKVPYINMAWPAQDAVETGAKILTPYSKEIENLPQRQRLALGYMEEYLFFTTKMFARHYMVRSLKHVQGVLDKLVNQGVVNSFHGFPGLYQHAYVTTRMAFMEFIPKVPVTGELDVDWACYWGFMQPSFEYAPFNIQIMQNVIPAHLKLFENGEISSQVSGKLEYHKLRYFMETLSSSALYDNASPVSANVNKRFAEIVTPFYGDLDEIEEAESLVQTLELSQAIQLLSYPVEQKLIFLVMERIADIRNNDKEQTPNIQRQREYLYRLSQQVELSLTELKEIQREYNEKDDQKKKVSVHFPKISKDKKKPSKWNV